MSSEKNKLSSRLCWFGFHLQSEEQDLRMVEVIVSQAQGMILFLVESLGSPLLDRKTSQLELISFLVLGEEFQDFFHDLLSLSKQLMPTHQSQVWSLRS